MSRGNIFTALIALVVAIFSVNTENSVVNQDLLLTYKQKQTLDQLKTRVSPILPHAYMKEYIYLVRWLRAQDFNLARTEELLKADLRWRKATKIDKLQLEDFSDISFKYPAYVDTYDKNGAPVVTGSAGKWDLREAHLTGKAQRLQLFLEKVLDEASAKVRAAQQDGKNVTRFHIILNDEGFNLIQHGCAGCVHGILNFLRSYENHFPGMVDKLILINAPPTIRALVPILRTGSSAINRNRVVFGNNKAEWQPYLLKLIDKNQLTEEYGGTRIRDIDP